MILCLKPLKLGSRLRTLPSREHALGTCFGNPYSDKHCYYYYQHYYYITFTETLRALCQSVLLFCKYFRYIIVNIIFKKIMNYVFINYCTFIILSLCLDYHY